MAKIFVLKRIILLRAVAACALVIAALALFAKERSTPAAAVPGKEARIIHMVTGEFKTTTADGREIEAYRWDPGTIVVSEGELVKLSIYGINGESHPFVIEGLQVKEEVKKGEETVVTFTAARKGIYRIICLAHPDIAHNGPMIGYIVVI
ncbi:MAG TPA: cupredoxin domain-containing protein [Bacilli bacterium]